MTENLSPEQNGIVTEATKPLSVIACAGSGKTRTAIHRLNEIRNRLIDGKIAGRVALLSFSNVAVDTFKKDYRTIGKNLIGDNSASIETMDGFLTKYILRPHSHRTMGSSRSAFLVQGSEPFLKNYTVFDGERSHETSKISVCVDGNRFSFKVSVGYQWVELPRSYALAAIAKLGKTGAYTHDLGRYWACLSLIKQPFLLLALARRYPHILVDEAQDIGSVHQAVLTLLESKGSQLSLIGDTNQGIYEFAGADGSYLLKHNASQQTVSKTLSRNYRSVPSIVAVANSISKRIDSHDRDEPEKLSGAYVMTYSDTHKGETLATFEKHLERAGISNEDATVIFRSNIMLNAWTGGEEKKGRGILENFVNAAIARDRLRDYHRAYKCIIDGIILLLDKKHHSLSSELLKPLHYPQHTKLRRLLWQFAKKSDQGVPSALLKAKEEWHPRLVCNVKLLLEKFEKHHDLCIAKNIGNKLAKTGLDSSPICGEEGDDKQKKQKIRTCTVHQVKGESIDGVMYIANKNQVAKLIEGSTTEIGRIGYVAVTRARNLFVLAVPKAQYSDFESDLAAHGFSKL